MMRIGKRTLKIKGPAAVGARIILQIHHRTLGDVCRRIERFRHSRAPGLRRSVAVARELVLRAAQRVGVRMARLEPARVVADGFIAVADGKLDVIKAVIGERRLEVGFARPGGRQLLVVAAVPAQGIVGFAELYRRLASIRIGFGHAHDRRVAVDALQMTFADERGVVTRGAHNIDERGCCERKRNAVLPCAVQRRHTSGHQRRAIRHADRRRHIKALETRPVLRQPIDIRRAHHWVAVAAEMIGAMLIGDDKEKVGSVRHSRRPSSFIILALRCNAFSAHKFVFAEAIRL